MLSYLKTVAKVGILGANNEETSINEFKMHSN